MKLKEIIQKCDSDFEIINYHNQEIRGISMNSREIRNNYIFGAIRGGNYNGEEFIKDLLKKKNIIVILSCHSTLEINSDKYKKIIFLKVIDVRLTSSQISSIIYKNSIRKKFAVTGTNGKTSVASYVHQIWKKNKIKSACIGTLGIKFKNKLISNTNLTTPDAISNHKILKKLSNLGCERVIYEASSIGLDQKRLYPMKFDVIAFTNLSKDHLDYHKNMNNYKDSKALLFKLYSKKSSIAVINTDSKYASYFLEICNNNKIKVLDFGEKANFLRISQIKQINKKFEINIILKKKNTKIIADCLSKFEIYNRICSIIMAYNSNLKIKHLNLINQLKNASGRLEKIYERNRKKVFVDYAHTPHALSEVLSSLRTLSKGKLFLVFGCGGDRDKSKRNQMTKEALKHADFIIITDDNPRFEDPKVIRNDMLNGIKISELQKIKIIGNRERAIKKAIRLLSTNDILLIAGKGHEDYQIVKNKKINFSDKDIARKFLLEI